MVPIVEMKLTHRLILRFCKKNCPNFVKRVAKAQFYQPMSVALLWGQKFYRCLDVFYYGSELGNMAQFETSASFFA